MAQVKQYFSPLEAVLPSSAFPQFKMVTGTNFPVPSLAFDAAVDEACHFTFSPINYGSGNIMVKIRWYADTATSGSVRWAASIAALSPNSDAQDIETKAFDTAVEVGDAHLGTTGQRVHEALITIGSVDSIANGDYAVLKVSRLASLGTDTMAGDALLVGVEVEYSDL